MSRTLGDTRDDVRDHLLETVEAQWTDQQLDRWINDALRDIARRAEILYDRVTVAVVSGTQEYSAPADTLRINRVEYKRSGDDTIYPLEYKDFSSMDSVWGTSQVISEGTPYYYTLWGFPPTLKIVTYPTPTEAGTLKVFYFRLPAPAVSDSTYLELPAGWEDIVSFYCEYMALRRDADPRWQEAKTLYEDGLANMITTTRRWTDQSGSIDYDGNMLPAWLTGGDGW